MSSITIQGNVPLSGEVNIQGSKNAVLPIIAATLLIRGISVIKNCPRISDVDHMIEILVELGCLVFWDNDNLIVNAENVTRYRAIKESSEKKMRASILFLGALLGRAKKAEVSPPGGCLIGERKIDYHLKGLEELGIIFRFDEDAIYADAVLQRPDKVRLPFPSVGATENLILATVLCNGTTELYNAAREPEIVCMCDFLNQAGAHITGVGTHHLIIQGVKELHDIEFTVPYDRIVAGTYLTAVAAAGGSAYIHGVIYEDLAAVIDTLRMMGCRIDMNGTTAYVERRFPLVSPGTIVTEPFPGFPTDMQSQFMVLMSHAIGNSCIWEKIFEGRFLIAEELTKLGAVIDIEKSEEVIDTEKFIVNKAIIYGNRKLKGCQVLAKDLRGGAALVIAGLIAEGETTVLDTEYVNRGYVDICADLRKLGANIR